MSAPGVKVFVEDEESIERYTKEEADYILSDPSWYPEGTVESVLRERNVVYMTAPAPALTTPSDADGTLSPDGRDTLCAAAPSFVNLITDEYIDLATLRAQGRPHDDQRRRYLGRLVFGSTSAKLGS